MYPSGEIGMKYFCEDRKLENHNSNGCLYCRGMEMEEQIESLQKELTELCEDNKRLKVGAQDNQYWCQQAISDMKKAKADGARLVEALKVAYSYACGEKTIGSSKQKDYVSDMILCHNAFSNPSPQAFLPKPQKEGYPQK